MISEDFLTKKANHDRIDKTVIIREYLQLVFLNYFYQKNKEIYFKGGTAIRFLFNSFRFSEDLDFTCKNKNEDVLKYLRTIIPLVENESGFEVDLEAEKKYKELGRRYTLKFQPNKLLKQTLRIKLDFSFREKPLEITSSLLQMADYPISLMSVIQSCSKEEILAEKIRAMFTRNKPRDLFDLWFLLKQNTLINWQFVIEKMKYYPEVKYSIEILLETLNKIDPKIFERDLGQFLPEQYREIYPLLISETIEMVKKASNSLSPFRE